MTNKHTPGPWAAEPYAGNSLGYKNGKAYYIKSDDGTPAFQVLKSVKFDHRAGETGHFWDPSAKAKDRANAALIAAAPELLAALENARIALTFYRAEMDRDNPGKSKSYPFGIDCENAARAAIAKAKGE